MNINVVNNSPSTFLQENGQDSFFTSPASSHERNGCNITNIVGMYKSIIIDKMRRHNFNLKKSGCNIINIVGM